MLYNSTKFRNTMIKSYYRISIEDTKNTNIVSNDEQMFSNENELLNDKKAIEQFLKFQNTKISAIISNAIISNANALNATTLDVFNRAKSEKTFQSSSIKRGRNRFRKQSNAQLHQSNLTIFLLNEIDLSTSSSRIFYAKFKKKKINDLLNKKIFDVMISIDVISKIKLFNFRFVDKIKNPNISTVFEKSQLVI